MFSTIRAALERRKQAARERKHEAGRRYVRQTLESASAKEDAVLMLEAQADNPFDADEFEQGMLHELRLFARAALTTPTNALVAQGA